MGLLSLLLRTPEAVATLSQGQPVFTWPIAGPEARTTKIPSAEYLIYALDSIIGLPRKPALLHREDRYAHAAECSRSISRDAGEENQTNMWALQGRTSW